MSTRAFAFAAGTQGAMRVAVHRASDGSTGRPETETAAWHALRVRSNFEHIVSHALEMHEIEEFLPLYFVRVRWSDRVRMVARPLFPGYIFSRFDPAAGLPVLEFAGVVGVLPSNLAPAAIPDSEIDSLRILCASGLPLAPAPLTPGRPVEVRRGPLAGARGVIARVTDAWRLFVSVEMMGRAVCCELDSEDVAACR